MYRFFTSIEFYVIACVVAAAIVIICAMPKQIGEARQFLLGGYLCFDSDDEDDDMDKDVIQSQPTSPETSSAKSSNTTNDTTGSNISLPGNVSITGFHNTPSALPPNTEQEASIVEVMVDGYRNISTGKVNKKGQKGKKQSSYSKLPPSWINGKVDGQEPEIDLLCLEDGTVKLIRKGLNGVVTADGAVSLACTLIGFDLRIEERLVYGGRDTKSPAPTEAVFTLDFLAPNEHYHIFYNSDTIHRMAAFTLATKGDIHIVKTLA